ncbi:FecR family protein [Filimonas effusa]|uniref:DUF4974 domain-containing protein n=1 Tax=Filimonas effusa TaxID=2508721 RepID=A0A4Q1DAB3_9BACT|nr:FecR family protein [Filimonas effusa]RXK85705.1 DUF4974 domain-containing protein [Filimonas effusa]
MELNPIDQERIGYLLKQYAAGNCARPELDELMSFIRNAGKDEPFHQALSDEWKAITIRTPLLPVAWEQMFDEIITTEPASEQLPDMKRRAVNIFRWTAAAAVLLLLATGAMLWIRNGELAAPAKTPVAVNDVAPGHEGAILTLANGSVVILDTAANGNIATQANVNVSKQNGQLVYHDNAATSAAETMMNTLATPRGRQYQLVLPDGTRAWLNAASSIQYPAAFSAKERRVAITGEVYFEVAAKAGSPFVVNAAQQELTVLGTHFNINAYNNENAIRTTLLQGSVRIQSQDHNGNSLLLAPGQQSVLNATGLKMIDVEAEQFVAWTKGQFWFHHASVKEVMQQLERWYNIEVVYQGTIPAHDFGGKLERSLPLSGILQFLEKSGIHYKLQERTLTIMPD